MGFAITGVLVVAATAYPLWMQFAGPQHRVGHPGIPDVYALKLGSLVALRHRVHGGQRHQRADWTPNTTEQSSFYGWSVVILVAGAAWWLRREIVGRVLALVIVDLRDLLDRHDLDLGHPAHRRPGAVRAAEDLPVFDSLVVARFALITTVALAVLFALAGDRLPSGYAATAADGPACPRVAAVGRWRRCCPSCRRR